MSSFTRLVYLAAKSSSRTFTSSLGGITLGGGIGSSSGIGIGVFATTVLSASSYYLIFSDDDDSTSSSFPYYNSTISTTKTTLCQEAKYETQQPKSTVNLQKKMTAIGHFSMISETSINPSIMTFFFTIESSKDKPFRVNDFVQLWKDNQMHIRHPRFHYAVDPTTKSHFIPKTDQTEQQQSNYNNIHNNDILEGDDANLNKMIKSHVTETIFPWGGRRDIIERIKYMQMNRWSLHDSLWHMTIAPWGPLGIVSSKTSSSPANATKEINDSIPTDGGDQVRTTTNATKKPDGESILFFRGHHSLGDGVSMISAFAELFDEAEYIREQILNIIQTRSHMTKKRIQNSRWYQRWIRFCQQFIQFLFGSLCAAGHYSYLQFMAYIWEYHTNPWNQIEYMAMKESNKKKTNNNNKNKNNFDDDDEITDRVISYTDVAPLEQIKWVANELGGDQCTVNDIFVSCLSAALVKQLQYHRKKYEIRYNKRNDNDDNNSNSNKNFKTLPEQRFMHIALPVHLKGGVTLPGESLGNNIGAIVARIPAEMENNNDNMNNPNGDGKDNNDERSTCSNMSQLRLRAVHDELYMLKRLPVALLSHISARAMSYAAAVLPLSWVSSLYAKSNAGSIAVLSNNRGTPMALHLLGRKVTGQYGFIPLPPGIPIGVVLLSYDGKVNCTLTAQKWAVPDADQFLIWILEEYMNLVEVATKQKEQRTIRI